MKTVIELAHAAGLHLATDVNWMPIIDLAYAERLVALARDDERLRLQSQIETLHDMYTQACRQRDELMDQQRAMVERMRGRIQ